MAVLARLDARIDRAEQEGAPHLALAAQWDTYLDALGEDRREDVLPLLAGPDDAEPDPAGAENAGDRELRELREREEAEAAAEAKDSHRVWQHDNGRWWTNYPPPAGFEGRQQGRYGDRFYQRHLSPSEKEAVDAREAAKVARAAAQRDAHFSGEPGCG
jgi:hypothetical protein